MNKKLLVASLLAIPSIAMAAASEVSVTINKLFVDNTGNVAIQLTTPLQPATNAECPANNTFIGVVAPVAKELVSALLAAKATQSKVTLALSGCSGNGAWVKLVAVYFE